MLTHLYPTLYNPMDSSLPGSSVHGFSRQVYWSGLPCPSPRNLLNPGIEPRSTALQVDSWPSEPSMKLLTLVRQFSHSIMSDSLWPHGLQHTRLLYPSSTPGACSNLCPLSQWCHLTISSSVISFSSCLQFFSASGYFPMSQFLASGGQIKNFSFSINPSNECCCC